MAKRFTDNEKWKDAWFMDLPSKYKLFWLYILDECNHAGIWKVNFKVASFHIGEHLEYSELNRILKDRITILNDEYWYIDKFIKYQYKCEIKDLNPKNKAHLSIIKLLNEYQKFKPLTSPFLGVKDKDKDNIDINNNKGHEFFLKESLKPTEWRDTVCMNNKLIPENFIYALKSFNKNLIEQNTKHYSLKEYQKHFVNWQRKVPPKK